MIELLRKSLLQLVQSQTRIDMKNLGFGKLAVLVSLFCLATTLASSAQIFTDLVSFDGADGNQPVASVIQGNDGNLYGTTKFGGAYGGGSVFRMTPAGEVTTLYSFCSVTINCGDGEWPYAPLVQAANGYFYGVTYGGGNCYDYCGTVFVVTPAGAFRTLYKFCAQANCPDGNTPFGGLVQGTDGNLYGTTLAGGTNAGGTIFVITPSGKFKTLYNFCSQPNCTDGSGPSSAMVLATNGSFYGTTLFGGTGATIFKINSAGKFTSLYGLPVESASPNGLIQASNGNFYGTAYSGGSLGTVFEFTYGGRYTTLYNFCSVRYCTDGSNPSAALVEGSDGNFYGTTLLGGKEGPGTVFQITPKGKLTTIHDFCSSGSCADGSFPYGGLVQATNGTFYGTASAAGEFGDGTVYSISMGLGPFVEAIPSFSAAGRNVRILGNNLTGTTSVSFNGTPAKYRVVSDTHIAATVPTGATTGTIEVTTPSGTLSSNVAFHVIR